jgi:Uma2 family endonuclease
MSTLPGTHYTVQEYLDLERTAEHKSEYYNGEIFAMAGASLEHNEIVGQLLTLIGPHARARGCRVFHSDMRVATPGELYTYPDLSVVCGPPRSSAEDRNTLVNPIVLVEVLSPSTELYDRGRKAHLYREIDSLQQLLLISQNAYSVELSTRQPDGSWVLKEFKGLDSSVELTCIGYTLHLRELYERVSIQIA